MTMPAGKYYVGDLCYVMHPEWKEVCRLFFPPYAPPKGVEGEFTLADGRRFASFATAYGDGEYRSSINTLHSVDSGSIGCILLSDIRDNQYSLERLQELGAIIDFEAPFEVEADYGLLKFGNVLIETAGDDEWEEEDEELEA
jgi:hypothetical protein